MLRGSSVGATYRGDVRAPSSCKPSWSRRPWRSWRLRVSCSSPSSCSSSVPASLPGPATCSLWDKHTMDGVKYTLTNTNLHDNYICIQGSYGQWKYSSSSSLGSRSVPPVVWWRPQHASSILCHIVSLQYLSRSSLHRLAGLHCRLFLSYGLQVVTLEVHRPSLRRLICPAQEHFIFLTV